MIERDLFKSFSFAKRIVLEKSLTVDESTSKQQIIKQIAPLGQGPDRDKSDNLCLINTALDRNPSSQRQNKVSGHHSLRHRGYRRFTSIIGSKTTKAICYFTKLGSQIRCQQGKMDARSFTDGSKRENRKGLVWGHVTNSANRRHRNSYFRILDQ